MPSRHRPGVRVRLTTPFALFALFFFILWIAGGASRADVLGQVLVRGAAWVLLVAVILFSDRPSLAGVKPVMFLLGAAAALALIQLIPLPPNLWLALPGREFFAEAAVASDLTQPWRPWAIVPSATENALSSLIAPLTALALVAAMSERERQWLPGLVLGFIVAATLLALLQFSGAAFDNPFINEVPGDVSGSFANRNHLALFLAFGCVLAPVWAFLEGRQPHWRGPVALGLVILFALTILASGSRMGLVLGLVGVFLGLFIVRQGIRKILIRYPRWLFPAIVGLIAIFVLISVTTGRAVSINRALTLDAAQDMRARALPTVLEMIRIYFPFGSGLGGFDPIFRVHEPVDLLAFTYHVHAHNDFLEIALDAGLPGILLLLAALLWWAWASIRAWRAGSSVRYAIPKLGSAILLLVFIASIFDFPARTPMIMAIIVMAGIWLGSPVREHRG